jgi:hypothetical protein
MLIRLSLIIPTVSANCTRAQPMHTGEVQGRTEPEIGDTVAVSLGDSLDHAVQGPPPQVVGCPIGRSVLLHAGANRERRGAPGSTKTKTVQLHTQTIDVTVCGSVVQA